MCEKFYEDRSAKMKPAVHSLDYEKSDKFWAAIDTLVYGHINQTSSDCLCFVDVDRWRSNLVDDMLEIIQTWQNDFPTIGRSEKRRNEMVNKLPLLFRRLGGYSTYEEVRVIDYIRLSLEKIYSIYVVPGAVFSDQAD